MSTIVNWVLRLPGKMLILKDLSNACVPYELKINQLSLFFIHKYSIISF